MKRPWNNYFSTL